MLKALIVEDDPNSLSAMSALVEKEGFEVMTAASLGDARRVLEREAPHIALVDLHLRDGDGLELLRDARSSGANAEFVVITGHARLETAVEALRSGAVDYFTKPVDIPRLKAVLTTLKRANAFRGEIADLRRQLQELGRFGAMVGVSPVMQELYARIAKVAPTDASVLISGDSGTGKELIAETLHALSRRSAAAFVAVNCGAISATLIESELFGHERGSFTGADRQHRGYFERAEGGTLFLDEIGEMPLDLQVKLLRVLESGTLTRVGGDKLIKVDVRVIAASNRDLEDAVAQGKFRADLLYRLRVVPIAAPPLRLRDHDVDVLAEHFLAELNQREGAHKGFSADALALLRAHAWPGNVRELKNLVHQLFILSPDLITAEDLPGEIAGTVPAATPAGASPDDGLTFEPGTALAEVERRMIAATLTRFAGDKKRTAEALGISLKTLYNRLREYGYAEREA